MTGVVEVLGAVGSAAASAAPYVSAGMALASAGLQIVGAQRQASVLRAQAAQSEFAAEQELLRGREQANQIRRQLASVRAAQNARYAAAGVLLDDGTPETVISATEAEADRQVQIVRTNAVIASEDRRLRGGMLNDQASTATSNAWWQAGAGLFDYYDRWSARQPGTTRSRRTSGWGTGGATIGSTAGALEADAALGALY